ncbi:MAG: hypothetical protein ACOC6H_01870 [Thermoproteota archaeon]
MSVEDRIEHLEKEIRYLKNRISMLIHIADPRRSPFTYLALEFGLTKEQIDEIYDLMDRTRESIEKGNPINSTEFEEEVYRIAPSQRGHHHFPEAIVRTLNEEGKYRDVYEYMKKRGMKLQS